MALSVTHSTPADGTFSAAGQAAWDAAHSISGTVAATDVSGLATVATSGAHGDLSGIGTNTHAQIDTHLANTSNPHSVTASQVGLGNLTNDTQTKAAIVPNTAPSAGQVLVGNAGGTAYAPVSITGSGATVSLSSAGVVTISSIANASLANSSITIAGTSTALGGSITQDTITGLASTGIVKRTGANTLAIAAAGTDYEAAIAAGTTAQYWRGDKSWQTLNATAVGLANVTNDAQTKASVVPNTAPTNGQLLIGHTANGSYSVAALTAGSNITITNSAGGITIAANAASGITVGTSGITGGTSGRLLYDNAGVVGEAIVGSGLSLSAGTLSATGGSGIQTIQWFGDGSDGDVTINSGTTTLTRDMFYNNLTISGTGSLVSAGFRVFVKGTLDLTAAPALAFNCKGPAGGNASVTAGGSAGTNPSAGFIGVGQVSAAGQNGGTANGSAGSGSGVGATTMGGLGGVGGAGGNGASGTGGTSTSPAAITTSLLKIATVDLLRGASQLGGGNRGSVGGSGAGDGTAGGGSGACGGGGHILAIFANTISRGGSTAAGALDISGGNGGNGAQPAGGNRGGGGAGGGGGGGWAYIVYATLSGSAATNAIKANGGNGGNGGTKQGTGTDGGGGTGGRGGRITLVDITNNTVTEYDGTSTTGSGPSGTTGGSGATYQQNL